MFLLSSTRFSRLAVGAAILFTALLVYPILAVRSPSSGLLISNLLQCAIAFWAAYCSLGVAKQSLGYLRRLWILFSAALFLVGTAQALQTYYRSFLLAQTLTPWPSDLLFFLWVTPAVMMFLPPSFERSGKLDWPQVLDYAQIGVVALTTYLYFFYVPSQWEAEGPRMLVKILEVQLGRDTILAAAFFVWGAMAAPRRLRRFFAGVAVVFFLSGASDLVYLLYSSGYENGANWTDLWWCAPFLFATIFAAIWNPREEVPLPETSSPLRSTVLSQVFPIVIPVLVLFMGHRIATEQMTFAWIAITTAFLLSFARLALTTEKQRRFANDLLQTQKALHLSERMFSKAFRLGPDAVGISSIPEGVFVDVNDSFTHLTGYARAETQGRRSLDMNLWVDTAHRARVMSRLLKDGEVREEEFQYRTKTGEIRVGQFSATVVQLDEGPCVLGIMRDISARKRAEGALRASEERFRTLVREMDVGVILAGPDADIQFANQAAQDIFGIPLADVKGKTGADLDLIPSQEDGTEIPFSNRPVPWVIRTGQALKNQVIGWRWPHSDKVLWTLSNSIPLRNAEGNVAGVLSTFTNITERRRAEDALRQLSSRLLQLQDEERRRLGRELHDSLAQTVLAVNLNLAQAVQAADSLSEHSRQALEEARRLLQEMSQEIRTLSYLLHPPLLDELGLVSAIREYAEGFSERSGIQLELDLPVGFSRLPQEAETALFRIVQESLSNIQRHSGSEIARVSVSVEGGWVKLEVQDRGCGMERDTVDLTGPTRARLGVGILGMRERMTQLGGKLEIASSPSGTTVRATMPLKVEVADASAHSRRG